MKYCVQCGNQIDDGAMFCTYCGAPQNQSAQPSISPEYQPQMQPQPAQPMKPQKPRGGFPKILFVIIPLVVLVIVLALALALNRRGAKDYRTAVSDFFTATSTGNPKKMVKTMMPSDMEKAFNDYLDEEGEYDNIYDALEAETGDVLEDGGIEFKNVNITDKVRAEKSEIKELNEALEEELDLDIEFESVYMVDVEYKYRHKGDKAWSDYDTSFIVYEVKGRWYAMPDTLW